MDIIESCLQHLKVVRRHSDNFSLLRTKDKTEIRRNFEAKSIGRDHIVKHIPDHEVNNYVDDNCNDFHDVNDFGNNNVVKKFSDHIVKHIPDHEVKSKIMATMSMMAIRLNLVIITMIIMMLTMLAMMLSKN